MFSKEVLIAFLVRVFRYVLGSASLWLMSKGLASEEEITMAIVGLATFLATAAWTYRDTIKARVLLLTGLASPKGTSVDTLKDSIASGCAVPVATPNDAVPRAVQDNGTVKPPIGAWLLPLLVVSAASCATVQPNPPTDNIQTVRNQAAVLAKATKEAATLAVEARRLAQVAYDRRVIAAPVMQRVNNAALVTSEKGLAFITFAETVTTDPSLRVTAAELYKVFQNYIEALSQAGQTGEAIANALRVFVAYLGTTNASETYEYPRTTVKVCASNMPGLCEALR
jgi:hypothetical protein